MAKTAQEKLDAKREKEYNKKHKRMYKRSVGDVVFEPAWSHGRAWRTG